MQRLNATSWRVRPIRTGWGSRVLVIFLAQLAVCWCHAAPQAIKVVRSRARPDLFGFAVLTVTVTPALLTFNLVPGGVANASSVLVITTTYSVGVSLNGALAVYAYFLNAGSALSGGVPLSYIPSSDVFALDPTGAVTVFTPLTQTTPFSGPTGLLLYSLSSIYSLSGTRSDNVSLRIDLTATPQLPAAIYLGSLFLQAQSF